MYANPKTIIDNSVDLLLPTERLSTAEFTEKYLTLANMGGGSVGRIHNDKVPYLTAIMDALDDPRFSCVVTSGPAQSGKTQAYSNWLYKTISLQPTNFLWYAQTEGDANTFSKTKLADMIERHEILRSKLGNKPEDNSIGFKKFRGMFLQIASATPRSTISRSAGKIVADEIDAYSSGLGDIKTVLEGRGRSYGKSFKLGLLSHPDLASGISIDEWNAGIMKYYKDSDRRVWYWQCPECGKWSSPCPAVGDQMYMALKWDDSNSKGDLLEIHQVEESARLVCPHCEAHIKEDKRLDMVRTGKWVSLYQDVKPDGTIEGQPPKSRTAGFWILGVMSPFLANGIGELAGKLENARRLLDATGEDGQLKQVTTKEIGVPYTPPRGARGSVTAEMIAGRAEKKLKKGIVPPGVRFLTVGVDCQANRFEVLWRGWGMHGESWIVDRYDVKPADPARDPDSWLAMYNTLVDGLELERDAGAPLRRMRPKCVVIDEGGLLTTTQLARDFHKRLAAAGKARVVAIIEGREAWNIILSKGHGRMSSTTMTVSYPQSQAGGQHKANIAGGTPLLSFNANHMKDYLAAQLSKDLIERSDGEEVKKNWYIHIPEWLKSPTPPHLLIEQLVSAERRLNSGKWEANPNARNEMLDMMILCHLGAKLHGLDQIVWSSPPPWADGWDNNPYVWTDDREVVPDLKAENPVQVKSVKPGTKKEEPKKKNPWDFLAM